MNLVVQTGRFTQDPEIRYSQDGKAVIRGNIAVKRIFKQEGQPDADFFNIVAFGKTAEFIEKYFHKGMKAVVTGELRNDNYTDKDGVKRYNTEILVNNIEFAESKKSNETNNDYSEGADEDLPW